MIEFVDHEGTRYALIMRAGFHKEGIDFVTPDEATLQLGYMSRPEGYRIQPHFHTPFERSTVGTQEVLFVKQGRVRADFYTEAGDHVDSREVTTGDWLFLFGQGHGFTFLEPSVMIEVKNGPFAGDDDKVRMDDPEAAS